MLISKYKNIPSAGVMINEVTFGNFPLIMKHAGMDFILLDDEHGGFDYGDMARIIMGARQSEIPIVVRIADNSRKDITKIMDMGADGLLLPMTESAEEIRQVIKYGKYAPEGQRGISTNRGHSFYNVGIDLKAYMKRTNSGVMIFAQIESKRGIDNLNEILDVTGVDGIFVGPNDLAGDMGCIGEKEPILEAIRIIGQETLAKGKRAGIITETEEYIKEAVKDGYDMVCCGSEISFWKKGGSSTAERIHQL